MIIERMFHGPGNLHGYLVGERFYPSSNETDAIFYASESSEFQVLVSLTMPDGSKFAVSAKVNAAGALQAYVGSSEFLEKVAIVHQDGAER